MKHKILAAAAMALIAVALPARADQFACAPLGIADFGTHVRLNCNGGPNEIHDFAIGTADPNRAARIMALGAGAILGGLNLDVSYDLQDTSGAAIGCDPNSCRLIQALALLGAPPV